MDIILEEMQDVGSSCIDEVILPEKEENKDLELVFSSKLGLTFLMLTTFLCLLIFDCCLHSSFIHFSY